MFTELIQFSVTRSDQIYFVLSNNDLLVCYLPKIVVICSNRRNIKHATYLKQEYSALEEYLTLESWLEN